MTEHTVKAVAFFEARPAALFVQTAGKYLSRVLIKVGEKTANAKSIMGVIALGIENGQSVTIIADGEDEQQAIPALAQFFNAGGEGSDSAY